jgi:Na+-translocating ferredoxin:NAD+ oxidoreductase RnfG subunit
MKKIVFLLAFASVINISFAQASKSKEVPVLKEISGIQVIKTVYPDAAGVEKINDVWFRIVDAGKKQIGYALSSKPFSDDIKGYHNTTPVIVVLNQEKIIQKVGILSHWETTSYINRLERQTFFNNWNGMTVENALKKRAAADSYTGATISATALSKNVEVVLKKATENKVK